MYLRQLIKSILLISLLMMSPMHLVHAQTEYDADMTIDRIQLVNKQIDLLKNRLKQGQAELTDLQQQHDQAISELNVENTNKNNLEKATLDITVAKSNAESVTLELTDAQQNVNWLEKNIQELGNQLNVLSIFGLKISKQDSAMSRKLQADLDYQQSLLTLEKNRVKLLLELQTTAHNILQFRTDQYNRLNTLMKSRRLLNIKQQQVKDELSYQQLQQQWLQQINILYDKLAKLDPTAAKREYNTIEREIFYANENATYTYFQSLIARYKDQLQQMKLAILKNNSISLLNEIGEQVQALNRQMEKLQNTLQGRITLLNNQIHYLGQKSNPQPELTLYVQHLQKLVTDYQATGRDLTSLKQTLSSFRTALEQALQTELSARQGFPTLSVKTFLDIGKEILLVPALSFQIIKSFSAYFAKAITNMNLLMSIVLIGCEILFVSTLLFLHGVLTRTLAKPSAWRERINSKWLSLQWLQRNFIDIAFILNFIGLLWLLDVPIQNFAVITYLALVWIVFKSILTISRLCLVETPHDNAGHDIRLYHRLKWMILIGAVITALTVFLHQLPLIYELKTLCDRLFLFLLMIVSLFLLRSSDAIPYIVLPHMKSQHPYLQKSIHLIAILVPLLIFGNSIIGLMGFVNLIMTVSWYEGVFLIVLIGYLILRGLLSDGMEQLSRLMIQYVNNGWLWTEAFLKPLDKVLRITLFLSAWAVLFLFYGWDKQSPIVTRLMGLLHYQLAHVLETTITPLNIIELFVVISIFYWTAKWTREFVYRMLGARTQDLGIRNSLAILAQYSVIMLGFFICLKVLGISLEALTFVAGMFSLGVGLGLRDLANNFACGFLILLERPLRVGDIVNIGGIEGDVISVGSRAVTVRTWDNMELVVPNTEIFNKSFTNWTAHDNVVRSVGNIKISRHDNPHEVKEIIRDVLTAQKDILKEPAPEVLLKEMSDILMDFEIRYFVNIRQVRSRVSVMSAVLMTIWDEFIKHGIEPAYPQHEVFLKEAPAKRPMTLGQIQHEAIPSSQ